MPELTGFAHSRIGCIDLDDETSRGDRRVLRLQRVGQRVQIRPLGVVIAVDHDLRDDAERRGGHERLNRSRLSRSTLEIANVTLQSSAISVGKWPAAHRTLYHRRAR